MTRAHAPLDALAALDPDTRDRLTALTSRLAVPSLIGERALDVHPALSTVLPLGVPRGATVGCQGQAAMSGACLVAAAGSQAGAWTGVAGVSAFGLQAAAEAGVVLERVIAVRDTAEFSDDTWGQVLGALIDGFDIVLFGGAARVRPGTARRVQTRLQHRGAVLVLVGTAGAFSCDLVIDTRAVWEGLAVGHGRLRSRRVEVSVEGRRVPRARHDTIWFPDADGHVGRSMAEPVAVPAPDPTAVPGHVPVVVPLRRTG